MPMGPTLHDGLLKSETAEQGVQQSNMKVKPHLAQVPRLGPWGKKVLLVAASRHPRGQSQSALAAACWIDVFPYNLYNFSKE